jgi:MoaA/NifB/PqqE/SkfB family radical SAM enzyme
VEVYELSDAAFHESVAECCEITLPPIVLPESYNYVGVFLTLDCNLHCSYCINRFDEIPADRRFMSGSDWIRGLNRITPRQDIPLSLQGGEPTVHPDFYSIINGVNSSIHLDILTNLEFDIDLFIHQIDPERIKRDAPYASIRVSYHPEVMNIDELAVRVIKLKDAGYSIGIWGVLHPKWEKEVLAAQDYCLALGIDFRTKEFLGNHEGVLYGTYAYQDACDQKTKKKVSCRTSELLIGPEGNIYRCHADLYGNRNPIGHLLNPSFKCSTEFLECTDFGGCNPCDVKLKTDRFQQNGHTSVEISLPSS